MQICFDSLTFCSLASCLYVCMSICITQHRNRMDLSGEPTETLTVRTLPGTAPLSDGRAFTVEARSRLMPGMVALEGEPMVGESASQDMDEGDMDGDMDGWGGCDALLRLQTQPKKRKTCSMNE